MKKVLVSILLIALLFSPALSTGSDNPEAIGDEIREYYIRIDLSQWEIVAYDLNLIEDLMLNGKSSVDALQQARYTKKLTFTKNSRVHLQVFSRDVQHGISIPQLDIHEVIERRDYSVYTFPVYIDFTGPNKDTTYELNCHVYCGLGHSDMKFKLIFGEGSKEYGIFIYYGFILINIAIFLKFAKKLLFDKLVPTVSE